MGVFAGHYELPPAEHPNAKTSSAARQAVAGESESNAKCGGEAVNSGEGIGCSTASIGDSKWIRKPRLSQLGRGGVAGLSWRPVDSQNWYLVTVNLVVNRTRVGGGQEGKYRLAQAATDGIIVLEIPETRVAQRRICAPPRDRFCARKIQRKIPENRPAPFRIIWLPSG